MEEKIVIIDANSLVNRAYYAIRRPMMTKDGLYTHAVYGFISMLQKIRREYEPTHMLIAFDKKGPTFRHEEYEGYKEGRAKMPPELAMQIPVLKEVIDAMGIKRCELDGYEADDIIGTTAKMAEAEGLPAFIVTGDRDALQLATGSTSVVITVKGISEFKLYDDAAMFEEYGFDHNLFVDYKGLSGDSSDRIPGIPGVGDVTAKKLIKKFGSLEEIIANTEKIESVSVRKKVEEGAQLAVMSKRLATIVTDLPVDYSMEDCRVGEQDNKRLIDLYSTLEFKTFLSKLVEEIAADAAEGEPSSRDDESIATLKVLELNDTFLKELKDGQEIWVDVVSDFSHTGMPSIEALEFSDGNNVYAGVANPSLLSGKALTLCGYQLGRVYYVLGRYGVDISNMQTAYDGDIARYVLSPSGSSSGLRELIFEYFHLDIEQQASGEQIDMFKKADSNAGLKYACLKALRALQEKEIGEAELGRVYSQIELPLCRVLAEMELSGIDVDAEALANFGEELKAGIMELEKEIHELAGEEFNINSPQQLGNILFEKLKLPSGKKTKTGYSTSADILEKLAEDHPIVEKVLEYRTLAKLNSTYVEGMLPLISAEGRIHAHFKQTVTATGRISCTEPNLQNIPVKQELGRQLRKAFTAGGEDMVLIGADYSQIELRVMAHMSGDPTLIQAFNDGKDIHKETASKIFGVPESDVSPLMRMNAKAINFGVIYGMSSFGLGDRLSISRRQAEEYIDEYFRRFPKVKEFMDASVENCRKSGEIRTLFGRRRRVPEINARQYMVRQAGERLAMNTPIQGTAADIIKIAMRDIADALKTECPGSELILQIHDELIVRAPKRHQDKAKRILEDCMRNAACLDVNLVVDLNAGENWYVLK